MMFDTATIESTAPPSTNALRRAVASVMAYLRSNPQALCNLLFLFLIIEYVALGKFSFIQIHDFGDDIFPRYIALWRNFSASGFQAWSSDLGGGGDRLANLVGYTNVMSLLIAVLPPWLAFQVYVIVTTYAGMRGFNELAGATFNYPKALSALIAFLIPVLISLINSTGLSAGIQFYPFVLYGIYWIDSRFSTLTPRLLSLIGLLYLSSITLHFTLAFVYLGPFLALWFAVVGRIRWTTAAAAGVAFAVAFLIHYADISALMHLSPLSHRVEFVDVQTNEGRLYFTNAIGLVFAAALCLIHPRIIGVRLVSVMSAFLLITFGDSVLVYVWSHVLGKTALATLKISRLGFFSTSLIGIATLVVASQLTSRQRQWLTVAVALYAVFLAVELKRTNIERWVRSGNYVANFEAPSLKRLRESDDDALYRIAVLEGVTYPNMLSAYGFESADGYSPMYPLRYKHYWAHVIAPVLERDANIRPIFLDWGSRFSLWTGNPAGGRWTGSLAGGKYARYDTLTLRDFFNLNLLSLANVKYIVSHQPIIDERLELVSEGVNALPLGTIDKLRLRLKENFLGRQSLFIYKNAAAFERAFMVSGVKYFQNENELLAHAALAPIDEMKRTAFVLDDARDTLSKYVLASSAGSVRITKYAPSRIELLASSPADGLVVFTASFDANWRCASNGQDLDVVDAYGAFAAVMVPAGESRFICQYQPHWASRPW